MSQLIYIYYLFIYLFIAGFYHATTYRWQQFVTSCLLHGLQFS